MKFAVADTDGKARRGQVETARGVIDTPAFMPVGTVGSVRSVSPQEVAGTGAQIILGNTFHLMLRPGTEIINLHGSLHDFMGWKGPILTDSGGFQVWSLARKKDIREEGVTFRSPVDESTVFLGPETSMQVQKALGSDIVMCFDECTAYPATVDQARESMELSLRWAERCRDCSLGGEQSLFGIAQGGMHEDLRLEALERLQSIVFDGYALGGLAVGETQKQMFKVLDYISPLMPKNKPRYLMGVGSPSDILGAVKRGIDMFDCVMPTRSGRTGLAFTWNGPLNLRNSKYKNDDTPIDPNIKIRNLNAYSKSYINHLINTNEILASMILTLNNIVFYQQLMKRIRDAIKSNNFKAFYDKYINII